MSLVRSLRWSWLQLLGVGPAVLVVALLPSFLYLGHWSDYLGDSLGYQAAEAATDEAERAEHRTHCHFGPATCSEQPAPPNMRSFSVPIEVPMPEYTAAAVDDSANALEEFVSLIPTEPPRL